MIVFRSFVRHNACVNVTPAKRHVRCNALLDSVISYNYLFHHDDESTQPRTRTVVRNIVYDNIINYEIVHIVLFYFHIRN